MHDTTAIAKPLPPTPEPKPRAGKNANPRYAELYRQLSDHRLSAPARAHAVAAFRL